MATHDPDVVEQTLLLALDIGEPKAIKTLRVIVADRGQSDRAARAGPDRPGRAARCRSEPASFMPCWTIQRCEAAAIRALAAYNDPATPQRLLSRYASLSESERDDAIATLSARPAWALALLDAVGNKTSSAP